MITSVVHLPICIFTEEDKQQILKLFEKHLTFKIIAMVKFKLR